MDATGERSICQMLVELALDTVRPLDVRTDALVCIAGTFGGKLEPDVSIERLRPLSYCSVGTDAQLAVWAGASLMMGIMRRYENATQFTSEDWRHFAGQMGALLASDSPRVTNQVRGHLVSQIELGTRGDAAKSILPIFIAIADQIIDSMQFGDSGFHLKGSIAVLTRFVDSGHRWTPAQRRRLLGYLADTRAELRFSALKILNSAPNSWPYDLTDADHAALANCLGQHQRLDGYFNGNDVQAEALLFVPRLGDQAASHIPSLLKLLARGGPAGVLEALRAIPSLSADSVVTFLRGEGSDLGAAHHCTAVAVLLADHGTRGAAALIILVKLLPSIFDALSTSRSVLQPLGIEYKEGDGEIRSQRRHQIVVAYLRLLIKMVGSTEEDKCRFAKLVTRSIADWDGVLFEQKEFAKTSPGAMLDAQQEGYGACLSAASEVLLEHITLRQWLEAVLDALKNSKERGVHAAFARYSRKMCVSPEDARYVFRELLSLSDKYHAVLEAFMDLEKWAVIVPELVDVLMKLLDASEGRHALSISVLIGEIAGKISAADRPRLLGLALRAATYSDFPPHVTDLM